MTGTVNAHSPGVPSIATASVSTAGTMLSADSREDSGRVRFQAGRQPSPSAYGLAT